MPNNTYVQDLRLLEYFAVSVSKSLPTFRVHYNLSKDGTDLSVDMVQHTIDLDITHRSENLKILNNYPIIAFMPQVFQRFLRSRASSCVFNN